MAGWGAYRQRGRKRSARFEALQVVGDPTELGLSATTTSRGRTAYIGEGPGRRYVYEGQWLVRDANGNTTIHDDASFRATYEPAG